MATPKKSGAKKGGKKGGASAKSGLTFPAGRCGSMIKKGRYAKRVAPSAGVFAAAALEFLTAETLELATKTLAKGSKRITPRAICLAVRHDADLGSLLQNVTISRGGVAASNVAKADKKKSKKAGKKGGKKAKSGKKTAKK